MNKQIMIQLVYLYGTNGTFSSQLISFTRPTRVAGALWLHN
jgi:hypothetical protein